MSTNQPDVKLLQCSFKDVCGNDFILQLPPYQRPYSWRENHVSAFLKDISECFSSDKASDKEYMMGTLILHKNNSGIHDIVDGQQRLVTLTIFCKELNGSGAQVKLPLLNATFSEESKVFLKNTRKTIASFLDQNSIEKEKLYSYLTDKIKFTVIIIEGENALDVAYTFFDSSNGKGKPLTDFDLLKAHHLQFIPSHHEDLARRHNDNWQSKDDHHYQIFSIILRRLRMWARGQDRDTKDERPDFNEFSSVVEPESAATEEHFLNRYMQPSAFRSWRRIDGKVVIAMDFPVSDGESILPAEVTQTIEGGDAFFIYANRYHKVYEHLFLPEKLINSTPINFVKKLNMSIRNTYLQNAFQAAVLLYYDKFTEDRLIEIAVLIERIISSRRLAKSVRIEGTLSHVRDHKLIPIILNSVSPSHVYIQLLSITKTLQRTLDEGQTGVIKNYFDTIRDFYKQEHSKIHDKPTFEVSKFYKWENGK
ncbi:MAG: DUF262 domain-containing protein [Candidatus Moranbacteria bacterium]|nr:DUF262 domain-containing protein [Candidatus Moranbacteria bacterium]